VPQILQSARNTGAKTARGENEVQLMLRMHKKAAAVMKTAGEIDWDDVKAEVQRSSPTVEGDLEDLGRLFWISFVGVGVLGTQHAGWAALPGLTGNVGGTLPGLTGHVEGGGSRNVPGRTTSTSSRKSPVARLVRSCEAWPCFTASW